MNVISVCVSCNNDLKSIKIFGKPYADFVCGFWRKLIVGTEGLDDVIVLSAVLFAEFSLDKFKFAVSRFGHTV